MATDRRRAAAVSGLAAAVWACLAPIVGAQAVDRYSHASQYISELGARGMPNGATVSLLGFGVTGLLVFAFLKLARRELAPSRLAGAGVLALAGVGVAYLTAAFFRCDPGCPSVGSLSQSIHNASALFEYLGGFVGLLLLAVVFLRDPRRRFGAIATALAAVLVGIGFLGMLQPSQQEWRGLYQRLADGAIFAWIAGTSVALLRGARSIGDSARAVRDA
jgi:hypothetical membrane protein